jgi:putative addiction module killer protein
MVTIQSTAAFEKWLDGLRDGRAAKRVAMAIARLRQGLGDVASVGGGVSEVRIHYGPGYRLYSHGAAVG